MTPPTSESAAQLCPKCGGPIAIRNPTGKCDHLYYPDNVPKAEKDCPTKTLHVRVSMDGLRQNLARSYSELVEMLNYAFKHDFPIDEHELEEKLLSLRQNIGFLCCVYDSEDEEFSNLSQEAKEMAEITFNNVQS